MASTITIARGALTQEAGLHIYNQRDARGQWHAGRRAGCGACGVGGAREIF